MASLGECYFDLKGNKNEGWKKKRINEEMEKNVEMKSKIIHCQMELSFVLWPSSLQQLSSYGCFNT